jgi:mannose-6-phosphate isomerase-like protein (cupin superfamily)
MIFEDREVVLQKGQGIEIVPEVKHQFANQSKADVHFLVFSVPSTRGDRINFASAGDGGQSLASI